jgi:inactivated superfamily I helicase
MTDPRSPQDEDRAFLLADRIDKADQLRADRLRRQAERDAMWRKRMRSAAATVMAIGAVADHLERRMPEDDKLRIGATWIVEYAEQLEALLLGMANEEAEDD